MKTSYTAKSQNITARKGVRDVSLTVRLHEKVRRTLEECALTEERTASAQARLFIAEGLRERGYLKESEYGREAAK